MAQERRRRRRRSTQVRKRINILPLLLLIFVFAAVLYILYFGGSVIAGHISGNIYEKSDEKILKHIEKLNKKEEYLPNISVDGINIGGMSRVDAENKLRSAIKLPEGDTALVITDDGNKYTKTFKMDDFGIYFDLDGAIKFAYDFGRTGSDEQKVADFKSLQNNPHNFEVMFYDEAKIRSVADSIASGINIEPVDAAVKRTGSSFEITPSVIGYSMDANALYVRVLDAVKNRSFGSTVNFTITQTNPKYTEDDFKYINNEIGSCYSRYKGGDENRIQNLRNGCEKINGTVLYPNEVFSTNDHFNPCTYENGWRSAGTIVNGKVEDSIGGGMCQVSSALYQAVLEAELDVVERFNHSMKVGYADYAFDATLAGDYKDLKFKNSTGYPMYIESYLTSSNVVVKLYGYEQHDTGRKLEFKNKLVKTTPPGEPKVTEDNTKPEGYEKYEVTALDGKTYELYKYVYENGTLTDTVKINTSTYLPRRAEIVKGTKKEEAETESTTAGQPDSGADGSVQQAAEPQQVILDSVIEGEENLQ